MGGVQDSRWGPGLWAERWGPGEEALWADPAAPPHQHHREEWTPLRGARCLPFHSSAQSPVSGRGWAKGVGGPLDMGGCWACAPPPSCCEDSSTWAGTWPCRSSRAPPPLLQGCWCSGRPFPSATGSWPLASVLPATGARLMGACPVFLPGVQTHTSPKGARNRGVLQVPAGAPLPALPWSPG